MKNQVYRYFLAAAIMCSVVGAGGYFQPVLTEYPGGALWAKKSSISILKELNLTEDTTIRADELIIAAPIFTEGRRLHIDVRKLIFKPGGVIKGFSKIALNGPDSSEVGPQGDSGESFGGNQKLNNDNQGKQRNGGQGHPGKTPTHAGPPGVNGDQNPGEILIFATSLEGYPLINAKGQTGGKGGRGAEGGKGGVGGNGSRADMNFLGSNSPPGAGGHGGIGGSGGVGGQGGQGGRAIRVSLIIGHLTNDFDLSGIFSAPGDGGMPGEYGPRGAWGVNGAGGSEDKNMWGGKKEGTKDVTDYNPVIDSEPPEHVVDEAIASISGPHSNDGLLIDKSNCPKIIINQVCHQMDDVFIISLNDFEEQRFSVYKAWYQFHWTRALNLLVRDSLRLARFIQTDRTKWMDLSDIQALDDLKSQYVATIIAAWKDNFIAPLKEAPRDTPISEHRDRMLYIANQVVNLLEKKSGVNELKEIRTDLDGLFQQNLDAAYLSCDRYNQLKSEYLSYFFGASQYYTVPVCSGNPNFRDKSNISAQILLTVPFTTQMTPSLMKIESSFLFTLLPYAYAGESDYKVIYVPYSASSLRQAVNGEPSLVPKASKSGFVVGFGVPPEESVTLDSLSQYLRILAIQLGSQG